MATPTSDAARIVGKRLRDLRVGLPGPPSQQDVAELAGMHFTSYSKIERGESNVTLDTLIRVASALDCDPGELLSGLSAADLPEREHRFTVKDLLHGRGLL